MAVTSKTSRVEFRLSENDKRIIELAANYNKQSLSSYIISVIIKQAQLDLARNETITLNNQERDALLKALENPEAPNQALIDLFKLE